MEIGEAGWGEFKVELERGGASGGDKSAATAETAAAAAAAAEARRVMIGRGCKERGLEGL